MAPVEVFQGSYNERKSCKKKGEKPKTQKRKQKRVHAHKLNSLDNPWMHPPKVNQKSDWPNSKTASPKGGTDGEQENEEEEVVA